MKNEIIEVTFSTPHLIHTYIVGEKDVESIDFWTSAEYFEIKFSDNRQVIHPTQNWDTIAVKRAEVQNAS